MKLLLIDYKVQNYFSMNLYDATYVAISVL